MEKVSRDYDVSWVANKMNSKVLRTQNFIRGLRMPIMHNLGIFYFVMKPRGILEGQPVVNRNFSKYL